MRNWLIGFHIEEYKRNGVDHQQYGETLLDRLAEMLVSKGVPRSDPPKLYPYRQFYLTYPEIVETPSPQFGAAANGLPCYAGLWSRRLHDLRQTIP